MNTNIEKEIDYGVKELLLNFYNEETIKQDKTNYKNIDSKIPLYHSENSEDSTNGKLDIMIFNYFNKNEIDLIIENKIANSN